MQLIHGGTVFDGPGNEGRRRVRRSVEALLLLVTLLLPACVPFASRCENQPKLRSREAADAFERRRPKDPKPIAQSAPPKTTLTPEHFDEDRWGERVFDDLPPRIAPEINGGPRSKGGTPLVCTFEAQAKAGVDGVDDLNGRTWISISTPDLLVWATFASEKFTRGPRFYSSTGTFTFRTWLRAQDPVTFELGDYDLFSSNDYLGKMEGAYPGSVPFQIKSPVGKAECRATTTQMMAAGAREAEAKLEEKFRDYESWTPTLEHPLAPDLRPPIEKALGELEFFTEIEGAPRRAAQERLDRDVSRLWTAYIGLLQRKHDSLPPAGDWVSVNRLFAARVAGLACLIGDRWGKKSCSIELDLRVLADLGGTLCPVDDDDLGDLGPIVPIFADGFETSATIAGARVGGAWLTDAMDLTRLAPGSVLTLHIEIGGQRHETEADWDIPLVRIGKTYLRVD